jgi:hypothetical protein
MDDVTPIHNMAKHVLADTVWHAVNHRSCEHWQNFTTHGHAPESKNYHKNNEDAPEDTEHATCHPHAHRATHRATTHGITHVAWAKIETIQRWLLV